MFGGMFGGYIGPASLVRKTRHPPTTYPRHPPTTYPRRPPTSTLAHMDDDSNNPGLPCHKTSAWPSAHPPTNDVHRRRKSPTNDERPGHDDPPMNANDHPQTNLSKRPQRAGVKGHVEDSHNERVGMQAPRPKNPPCIIPHNVDFHQRTLPRRPTLPMLSKSWGEVAIPLIFRSSQGCTAVSIDTRTALARFIGHLWRHTLPQRGMAVRYLMRMQTLPKYIAHHVRSVKNAQPAASSRKENISEKETIFNYTKHATAVAIEPWYVWTENVHKPKFRVSVEDCMAENGTLRATCRACLTLRRERRVELERAAMGDLEHEQEAAALLQGDAEGVATTNADEFDAVFGDGADLMNLDLPDNKALTERESALLRNLKKELDKIKFETCDHCLEEGFGMNVEDGMCSSCRRDKADPVRKWSAANNVQPGLPFSIFPVNYSSNFSNSTRRTCMFERPD
ncbi:uncharacterized protein LACBIDRAFT_330518 [Laccaria bicolor S238N-H82]|uniref:Predicted protein n=1 Tax=Laccaria bicolor (strain S238N-H82 / ATCC MYA-4686) TaxID=486041 RepID=B0DLK1_LACBS|nr:uncharacterized protein LACBIDRAFT_330518 [Laccaria bicolor S238N-H82]EDR04581.1 predicted protein [Laccaria bicolor S238N-H82]|eukprot:XP_001884753.1 predicted protein [Laccaria bicolor S238N-H82]